MKYEYNKSVTDVSFFFRGLFSMYRYYDETHKKEILQCVIMIIIIINIDNDIQMQ